MDYLPMLEAPEVGPNPWTALAQQSESTALERMPQLQASMDQAQSQISQFNSYPTFPNPMGLGSQNPLSTPQAPQAPQAPSAKAEPSATSRSFNPWSLTGEALSR